MSDKTPTVIQGTDASGRTHVAIGYKAMKAAPDTVTYAPSSALKGLTLPPKVDLRPFMTKVEDQGQTSSCVANAVVGAYEYWLKRLTGKEVDVSRLFVYYNARWRNGDQDVDDGSVIQLAMESLGDFGICSEGSWPFDPKILTVKPNRSSYQEASELRVKDMTQVPVRLDAWRQALAEGLPIVFGTVLFDSFDQCNERHGVVPMPSPKDLGRAEHGGHAMCCVGYSDVDKVFIVRNSWGDEWGDQGYCYMPYNYLMNPKFNDGDCWVFRPDATLPDPRTTWVSTIASLLNGGRGVTFDVNPYPVTSYERVHFTYFETTTAEWNDSVLEDYDDYSAAVEDESWGDLEEYSIDDAYEMAPVDEDDEEADDEDEELDEDDESDEDSDGDEDDESGDDDDSDDEDLDDDEEDVEDDESDEDEEEEEDYDDAEEDEDDGDEEEDE